MAFDWSIFAEELGKAGEGLASGIRQRATDEKTEERLQNLASFRKKLDLEALEQELKFKSEFDGIQYSIGKDLQMMEPGEAQKIQGSVFMARQGYDVDPSKFTKLSDLNQAKIGEILRTNRLKNIDNQVRQDKLQLEIDQLEAYKERTGLAKATDREKAEEKAYKEETKEIETREKKEHDKSATLLKNAKTRLEKERSILATKSKPSQAESIGGILPASKTQFAKELENVENALDFISNAESYIAGGLPLSESQESTVRALAGDIKKLRSGKTISEFKAKMQKRGAGAYEDKTGLFIGEERVSPKDGVLYRYIGNDKWLPVR